VTQHVPPKLVIFDCDGVLVDSEPISIAVLVEAIGQAGGSITMDEAYDRFLGRSLSTIIGLLAKDYGLVAGEGFLEQMRHDLYSRFERELQPITGIAKALDHLDIPRCVASSSQPERIRLCLDVVGILPKLEPNIFSATMVKNGKPAPDLFLFAADKMKTDPKDCIVIEDSPMGIEAAKAAGMRVFAFTGGSHASNSSHLNAISKLEPDLIFDAMDNLFHLVHGEQRGGIKS